MEDYTPTPIVTIAMIVTTIIHINNASKAKRPDSLFSRMRQAMRRLGIEMDPAGATASKTHLPGSYRQVGPTCPSSCPHLNKKARDGEVPCYAQRGHVALAQRRAGRGGVLGAIATAAAAMVAGIRWGVPARLHVSGDFGHEDAPDPAYIYGLCEAAQLIGEHYDPDRPLAFSYTHFQREAFEPYRLVLAASGIEVSTSDPRDGIDVNTTAVFKTRAAFQAARRQAKASGGTKLVLCPAQTTKGWQDSIHCSDCGLCWQMRKRGIAVGFMPE